MEHTDDGHHVVINGRKWRATDPSIPEDAQALLRKELMSARRAVGQALKHHDEPAERAARARVQATKEALGERGQPPWWDQSDAQRRARWQPLTTALAADQEATEGA